MLRVRKFASSGKKLKWKRDWVELLILEHQRHEHLYNPKHSYYKNRKKRAKSIEEIVHALKTMYDKITPEQVKEKLQVLRGQYARELGYIGFRNETYGGDRLYEPKLWCFNKLNYLKPYCSNFKVYKCSNGAIQSQSATSNTDQHERIDSPDKRRTRKDHRSNSEDIADPLGEYHEHIDPHEKRRIRREDDSNSEDRADPLVENHEDIDSQDKKRTRIAYDSNSEDRAHPIVENHEHIDSHNQKRIRKSNPKNRRNAVVENAHNVENQRDEYKIFGDYIASEFRSLRHDHNRRLLRLKIQRAILDVADIDNRDANAKVSNLVNLLPSSTSIQLKGGHQDSEPQEQLICITGI